MVQPSTRRGRLLRVLGVLAMLAAGIVLLRGWHARSLDVELVHRFEDGDGLLPAEVAIQVWEADRLHADAYFPQPDSLRELRHTVRVPPGDYRVTYTVMQPYGAPTFEFAQGVAVQAEGSYYLHYRLGQ